MKQQQQQKENKLLSCVQEKLCMKIKQSRYCLRYMYSNLTLYSLVVIANLIFSTE